MINTHYSDAFTQLKSEVRKTGLLERVPVRGSVEMIAIVLSMGFIFYIASIYDSLNIVSIWIPIALGLFMTLVFTRAVFVSHDILHLQYFKNKTLSFKLSYLFSAIILSNSSSWWDYKHNVNHHTWCNVVEKDEDIRVMNGAFTPHNKGNQAWLRATKYLVFWGALFFMYEAFIVRSYNFVIRRKKWGELGLMLLHWPIVWGTIFYFLPLNDALIVYVTLNFTLSIWLSLGFITNHLGCEVFDKEEGEKFSWMELQMRTSRSLRGGRFIHWFYGGLNTQIEHHLFPKAPRFNLLKIQSMTRAFAKKHDLKYFETSPIEAYLQINHALKDY